MQERLQKIIAKAGLASRRAAEELVTAGRVRVNGRVVTELGAKADPRDDRIEVDGKRLVSEDLVYVVLHKPKNVVSTMSDPEGRPTVAEYLKDVPGRAYPVGRLDFATSGVLLATNDGDFANGLLHPKTDVPKTYVVKVQGVMSDETLTAWRKGVMLEDGKTRPAEVKLIRYEPGEKTWFEVTLKEGRNQQVRRMGDATGHRVMRLARVSFAGITAEGLRPGELRALTRDELMKLREAYGVPKKVRGPSDVTGGARRRNERIDKKAVQFGIEPSAARGGRRGSGGDRREESNTRSTDRSPMREPRSTDRTPMRDARPQADRTPMRESRSTDRTPTRDARPQADRSPTREPRSTDRNARPQADRNPTRDARPQADRSPTRDARPQADRTSTRRTDARTARSRPR